MRAEAEQVFAQRVVHLLEDLARARVVLGQVAAHADPLRALPGKREHEPLQPIERAAKHIFG